VISSRRELRVDGGFSLVELVVGISILGVLLGSVAMAMGTTVRVQAAAKEQLTNSQAQTRLSYRVTSDAQNALAEGGVKTNTSAATFAGCVSPDAKLWLQAKDSAASPAEITEVTYKLTGSDLFRLACSTTFPTAAVVKVAQNVQSAVPTIETKVVGVHTLVTRVSFKVTLNLMDGGSAIPLKFTAVASPRNSGVATIGPGGALPPPPPSTAACTVLPSDITWTTSNYPGMNPAAVVKIGRLTKRLKANVALTAKTSGACGTPLFGPFLVQREYGLATGTGFFTRTPPVPLPVPLPALWELAATASPVDWLGTMSAADGTWQETVRNSPNNWAPLTLNDVAPGDNPLEDANVGSSNKFVTAACRFDTLNLSSPVTINYRTKQPLAPVAFSLSGPSNNYCDSAQLYFQTGFTPTATPIPPVPGVGAGPWAGTIPVAAGTWSITTEGGPANPPIVVKGAEGPTSNPDNESSPGGGFTGSTSNACKVSALTVAPVLKLNSAAAGKLQNNAAFTATTAEPAVGPCANLTLRLSPGAVGTGFTTVLNLSMTRASANSWTVVADKNQAPEKWLAGSLAADVLFNGTVCCTSAANWAFTVAP
jgi:prepilin-type N-terminal cleavage/methylation domain-containing protein